MKRVYNCIESDDQHRDWSLQKAKALGLSAREKVVPASKDLREPWWNVGDQADTGSCVGWALADSVLRYHFVKAGKLRKHEHISVRYIWMAAKEMDHKCEYPTTFLDDAGTSAKTALQLVRKIGALKSSVLPFDGGLVRVREHHFLAIASRLRVRAFINLCGTQSGKLDRFKEWLAYHCTLPLIEVPAVSQVSSRLHNFAPSPGLGAETWNAADWWLSPAPSPG